MRSTVWWHHESLFLPKRVGQHPEWQHDSRRIHPDFVLAELQHCDDMSKGPWRRYVEIQFTIWVYQYGDCKDKAALLAALLEAEGLHASSTLINPDRKLDLDIPSPWPFTHVITMLQLGKDEIWMDPSAIVLPFRMLPYALRKKQALVMPPDGTPHFEETPADAPVPNTWLEDVDGKVGENGTLDATVRITARGDAEIPLRQAFLTSVKSGQPLTVHGSIEGLSRDDKV